MKTTQSRFFGVALNGVAFYSGAVDTECTILDVDDDTAEPKMHGVHVPSRGQMAALGSKEMTITERELLRRTSRRVNGGAPARPGWSLDDRSGQVGERARPFLAKPQSPTWLNLDILNRAGNPRPGTRGTRGRPEGASGRNSSAGTII